MRRILSIQYLRALASMSVVIFHQADDCGHWFDVGAAGVDIFFVISGFIMFNITEVSESVPTLFIYQRITRILPLYWVVTLLSVVLCLIHPHLMWHEDISGVHLLMSLLFIPHRSLIFPTTIIQPTLLQGWTLNIEMFFYVVVTGSLFLRRDLQIIIISFVLAGLVFFGIIFRPHLALLRLYSDGRLLEFVVGLWVGRQWVTGQLPSRQLGIITLCTGMAVFAVEQWLDLKGLLSPGDWYAPLLFGVPAALVVLGAVSIEAEGEIPYWSWLKILGDASFSIYLIHGIVGSIVNRLHILPITRTITDIITSAALGVAVYFLFERQFNSKVRRWYVPKHAS